MSWLCKHQPETEPSLTAGCTGPALDRSATSDPAPGMNSQIPRSSFSKRSQEQDNTE